MKSFRIIVNLILIIGLLTSTYFLYLALTPEGYTGIFIFAQYTVHSPERPLILMAGFVLALIVFNWKHLMAMRNKMQIIGLVLIAAIILGTVFLFLGYKRHNRLPWSRPNVVIIDVDTLRADHVSAYGTTYARTPNIDSLAKDGWLFKHAYSHIPITLPSHSSLFTGRLPHDVWVLNNHDDFTYPEPTLAEILKKNGYKTAGIISLGVLKSNFNINRGFDYYNDKIPRNGQWFNRANVVTDRGIDWLEKEVSEKDRFFLWLHYQDPHEPYNPPGSAPDTAVFLNDNEVTRGNLDSAAFITASLTLKPGKNTITFKNLEEGKYSLYFRKFHIYDADEDKYPASWKAPLENALRQSKSQYRRTLGELQERRFLTNFDGFRFGGMRFEEGYGWSHSPSEARELRRSIEKTATMIIYNESSQVKVVNLRCKGGVYKDFERRWKDYAAEVEYCDKEIGRVLDYLKEKNLMENTIIILMSDHGEELNEHGRTGHIHDLYTESTNIPLIIRDPNTDHKGKVVTRNAGIYDITPTILDMVGLRQPEYMQGKTLIEYVLHNRPENREVFMETFVPEAAETKFAVIDDKELAIFTPHAQKIRQLELYDLLDDPQQQKNLSLNASAMTQVNKFRNKLVEFEMGIKVADEAVQISAEREEMLKDLGYINASGSSQTSLDKLGYPKPVVVENVSNALNELVHNGVMDHQISVESIGSGSADPFYYLMITLSLPESGLGKFEMMRIHDFIAQAVMPQARQFPVRLIMKSGEKVLAERILAGNPERILDLYSVRLLRILMQQPFSAGLSPTYEFFFSQANELLEGFLGLDYTRPDTE